jgi:hypothetical protein
MIYEIKTRNNPPVGHGKVFGVRNNGDLRFENTHLSS